MARSTGRLSNAVVAMVVVLIVVAIGVAGLSLRCVPGLFWRGACPMMALPTAIRPADLQSAQPVAAPVAAVASANAAPTPAAGDAAVAPPAAAIAAPGTLTSNSGVLAEASAAGAAVSPSSLTSTAPDISGSPAPSTVSTALGGPTTRLVATTVVHAAVPDAIETLDTSVASLGAAPDDASAIVAAPPAAPPLAAIAAAAPTLASATPADPPVPADPPQRVASIPTAAAVTPAVAQVPSTGTVAPGVMIVSSGSGVTVRAGPNRAQPQVFALGAHEKVTVAEDQHGWLHITDSRGRTGWAYSDFFTKAK